MLLSALTMSPLALSASARMLKCSIPGTRGESPGLSVRGAIETSVKSVYDKFALSGEKIGVWTVRVV
jgi:hypothetical protein